MQNTYWNKQGTYQADYDRLVEAMPLMGNCDTVAGEMIRSVSRLGYDFYNNGMGNNTSGAVNFLLVKGAIDSKTHATIYEYTRGLTYAGCYGGDSLQTAIERAVDMTIKFILDNPQLETTPNTEDMFDYEDPEQNFCEECDDEVDHGYICCSHCEEAYEEEEEFY